MRKIISIILLIVICWGIILCLHKVPFGTPKTKVGNYYISKGEKDTGASNIVTSVVLNYRGFDTLGEITILLVAAIGLGAVLSTRKKKRRRGKTEPSSLVLSTGCKFLFPMIILFGSYMFIHGHLTPGGGFQGGAIIASGFVLIYLGCRGKRINRIWSKSIDSSGALIFLLMGLIGLMVGGHYFLSNFLPKGVFNSLFSAGIIPIIYIGIGFKVGSELAGVIDNLVEESE